MTLWALSVFIFRLVAFSHGYTPTFRNEATHPLKPPTESTLGLQLNDGSTNEHTSTNDNSPAHKSDAYLAGGKHFEYLLLNDSNVLLTSLQNDQPPINSPSSDRRSSRANYFNVSRGDSVIPAPFYTNSTKSFEPTVNKTALSTHKMTDITSTTKLYSKRANKTDENFATFTSSSASSSLTADKAAESLSAAHNFDYDDSFTKLLIFNGILKPNNATASATKETTANSSQMNDLKTSTTSRLGVEANLESATHISTQIATDSNATGGSTAPSNFWLTTEGNITYSTTKEPDNRAHSTTTRSLLKPYQSNKRKVRKHREPFGAALRPEISLTSHYQSFEKPPTMSSTRQDKVVSNDDVSNKNSLEDVYLFTTRSIRSSSIRDESTNLFTNAFALARENGRPLVGNYHQHLNEKPFAPVLSESQQSGSHNIAKKSYNGFSKTTLAIDEFKTLVERAIRCFFGSVARFLVPFDTEKSHERKVTLRRLIVATPSAKIIERYNWTYLGGGFDVHHGRVDVDPRLAQLFSDEPNIDVRWLAQLSPNSGAARDFGKAETLETVVPFGLDLIYAGCRIDGVLLVPRTLLANYSLHQPATTAANHSLIDAKEELIFDDIDVANVTLELRGRRYHAFQATATTIRSADDDRHQQPSSETRDRFVDGKHDDVELYVFVFLGAICTFGVLSPLLYGVYRIVQSRTGGGISSVASSSSSSSGLSFKWPSIFADKFQYESHAKMPESRCESLNVIFSEEFDRRYSSWFDNTQHSSSILKAASGDETRDPTIFNDRLDDFPEFSDLTRNVCENSPRLSKENRLNMGCRQSCVLLPNPTTYLKRNGTSSGANENENRCFDNPNYDRDCR